VLGLYWYNIIQHLGYKSKTEEASIVLNINNELCHDSKTIADFFNNFLTTVASELVKKNLQKQKVYIVLPHNYF
jgi:hypothetical protein